MEQQFSNQCDIVNQMKASKRWVFATSKKGWGIKIGREKESIENSISSERYGRYKVTQAIFHLSFAEKICKVTMAYSLLQSI